MQNIQYCNRFQLHLNNNIDATSFKDNDKFKLYPYVHIVVYACIQATSYFVYFITEQEYKGYS